MTPGDVEETDWMLDLECVLVDVFGWSLYEIDRTDIHTLLPFIFHYPKWKGGERHAHPKAFCDEVDWL
jgi:hypothetical protein